MSNRHLEERDVRFAPRVEARPGDDFAADRIRTVENDERLAEIRRRLHRRTHRANIGVKTDADVLNVENEHVDVAQHFRRRAADVAVKTEDRKARFGVFAVADIAFFEDAVKAVFRAKERRQLDFRVLHRFRHSATVAQNPGLIRQKADFASLKERITVAVENVDSGERSLNVRLPGVRRTVNRFRDKFLRRGGVRAFANRVDGDRSDLPGERINPAFAVRMEAVAEENDEQVEVRVDPKRRPGEAAVSERRRRHIETAVAGVRRALVPTERTNPARNRLRRRHLRERLRFQDLNRVFRVGRRNVSPATGQHRAENRHIDAGREKTRVSGDAVHLVSARVVNGALNPVGVLRRTLLRRRAALALFGVRIVSGIEHSQRTVNVFAHKLVLRNAGNFLDQVTASNEADVAVREFFARFRTEAEFANVRPNFVAVETDVIVNTVVRRQARNVRNAVAHRNVFLAVLREFREELRDFIVVRELAALDQNRDSDRRRRNFRNRRQVVKRVGGRLFNSRLRLTVAVSAQKRQLVPAPDRDDRARRLTVGDRLLDQRVDSVQRRGVHLNFLRRDDRKRRFRRLRSEKNGGTEKSERRAKRRQITSC